MRKLINYLFLFVLLFSCQKKIKSIGKYDDIVGDWKWEYSIDKNGDTTFSIQSNENRRIEVEKNGKINIYVNERTVYKMKILEAFNHNLSANDSVDYNYVLSVSIPFNSTSLSFEKDNDGNLTKIVSPLLKPNYTDYFQKK